MEVSNHRLYILAKNQARGNRFDMHALRYAHKWALIMEKYMMKGQKIKDCWKQSMIKAKDVDVTGIMQKKAENFLFMNWKYGESLRKEMYEIQSDNNGGGKGKGVFL